jgi:integrase/recombinase XerC
MTKPALTLLRNPLDDILGPFAEHLYVRRCSELTIRTFCEGLRLFVAWYEDRHGKAPKMKKLTRADMADYQQFLRTEPTAKTRAPAKPATIDKRLGALRAYYAYLAELHESFRSPMDRIKYEKKGAPGQPRSLSDKQLAKLLSAAHDRVVLADSKRRPNDKTPTACEARRDMAIVTTLAYGGLRVSELCALSIADLDLTPGHAQLVVRRGKGDKYREVELSNHARKALTEWLAWRKHYGGADGGRVVFVGRRGAMSRQAVWFVIEKLARQAKANGLDAEVTPHTLRHSFARRLVDRGAPLPDVQELLGHESIVTTSRYTRPSKAQRKAHVDKLDIEI